MVTSIFDVDNGREIYKVRWSLTDWIYRSAITMFEERLSVARREVPDDIARRVAIAILN